MRFAVLSNSAFSLVNFRGPLLNEIVGRGHTVFALAPDFTDATRSELRLLGVEPVDVSISRTGLNPISDFRDAVKLTRVLSALKLDALLGFAIKPVIYGTLAARLARIPRRYALIAGLGYAFGDHAKTDRKRRLVYQVARALYTLALGQATMVFMQNPDDVQDFNRLNISSKDKMVLVNGTGIDLADWPQLEPVEHPMTFLLAARLLAEKGIHDYVEAAKMIKSRHPQVRFLLLGGLDTNPGGIARAQIEQWVTDGTIEWPGHVKVKPWLGQASVFVLPSYYREGIPRSIQEALASGRPVITADTPGCRETVVDGRNGFLVPPRNPEALAAAMQRFIDDPGLLTEMGRESRTLAETRFNVRHINATMMDVMGL